MADGMCGPSNALQNFQKHSTIDRTLQQDRLISRQSPSQGFRSSGPNAGLLDHEFESFQAGQLPLDHGFQQNTFNHAPPSMQQPGPANWATDFQRMNISSPAPQMQQQPYGMHAHQRLDTGGWHQDFAQQQNQMAESSRNIQIPSHANNPYSYSPMPAMGMMNQFSNIAPQSDLSMSQQKQPEEAFDDEAFARAFEEAAQAEMESMQEPAQESAQNTTQHVEMGQEILLDESAEALMASDDLQMTSDELLHQERIGADTIHDPFKPDEVKSDHQDPEELARTAAKLLDSVQHDQSVKFQNSQFLSLMRQFRDKEKTVEGDHVVTKNGMGGDTNQEMTDERYQDQIKLLCDALKRMIDGNPPFQRTPINVRKLIHILLNMDSLISAILHAVVSMPPPQSTHIFRQITKFTGPMEALLEKPWLMNLPHVKYFAELVSYGAELPLKTKGGFREGHLESDPEISPADALREHDRRLTQKHQESAKRQVVTRDLGDELLETYVSSLLAIEGNTPEDTKRRDNALLNVLPYEVPEIEDALWMDVHRQRAREILGRYAQARDICLCYGIWSRDLHISDILGFMSLIEKSGLASEEVVAEANRLGRKISLFTCERIFLKVGRGERGTIQEQRFWDAKEMDNAIDLAQIGVAQLMLEEVAGGISEEEITDCRERYRKRLAEYKADIDEEFEEEIRERRQTGEPQIPVMQFILNIQQPTERWKAQDEMAEMNRVAVIADKITFGRGLSEVEKAIWERFERSEKGKKQLEEIRSM